MNQHNFQPYFWWVIFYQSNNMKSCFWKLIFFDFPFPILTNETSSCFQSSSPEWRKSFWLWNYFLILNNRKRAIYLSYCSWWPSAASGWVYKILRCSNFETLDVVSFWNYWLWQFVPLRGRSIEEWFVVERCPWYFQIHSLKMRIPCYSRVISKLCFCWHLINSYMLADSVEMFFQLISLKVLFMSLKSQI